MAFASETRNRPRTHVKRQAGNHVKQHFRRISENGTLVRKPASWFWTNALKAKNWSRSGHCSRSRFTKTPSKTGSGLKNTIRTRILITRRLQNISSHLDQIAAWKQESARNHRLNSGQSEKEQVENSRNASARGR